MANKGKRGTKENPISHDELQEVLEAVGKRDYVITEAEIKDGFCNYSYEKTAGIGLGDIHGVKGKAGMVTDDLYNAFAEFNVHLAILDDVFKHSSIQFESIEEVKNHELTGLYYVSGFKIKGGEDNEAIILIGTKYISSGGRLKLEIPKIPIDSLSSYKWYNELKEAADNAREEVSLYAEGKMIPVEIEEDDVPVNSKQLTIMDGAEEETGGEQENEELESEFDHQEDHPF